MGAQQGMTGKLLNEQSTKLMFSSATLDNGDLIPTAPGWMNWPLVGRDISQHSGAFRTGFSSQAFIIPECFLGRLSFALKATRKCF